MHRTIKPFDSGSCQYGQLRGINVSGHGQITPHIFFVDDMVLFAETSTDKIKIIKDCLEVFSKAFEQKVSLKKSQIFFSMNVERDIAKRISEIAEIDNTTDLERLPCIHKRVSGSLFSLLIDQISRGSKTEM